MEVLRENFHKKLNIGLGKKTDNAESLRKQNIDTFSPENVNRLNGNMINTKERKRRISCPVKMGKYPEEIKRNKISLDPCGGVDNNIRDKNDDGYVNETKQRRMSLPVGPMFNTMNMRQLKKSASSLFLKNESDAKPLIDCDDSDGEF